MNSLKARKQTGFTIVELLIVIVVIGILAAIAIVAYNGIQNQANISTINSSLNQLNKAIRAHEAINGTYPSTGASWVSQSDSTKDTFIGGLVPTVVNSLPRAMNPWYGSPTFYYRSDNGANYKLLYLYPSTQTIPAAASGDSSVQDMLDPIRPTRGWGYWTSSAVNY